jgi:hypothetical protein
VTASPARLMDPRNETSPSSPGPPGWLSANEWPGLAPNGVILQGKRAAEAVLAGNFGSIVCRA